jgi:hypothetical protein
MNRLQHLVAALWFGGALFLIAIAAPAAFGTSPSVSTAANVIGAMLTRWHYIALTAPLILLALEWRRARTAAIAVLLAAILFAAAQALADTRLRAMRSSSVVPISALRQDDPVRRRFGLLHGVSSILFLLQVISAGVVVARTDTVR